MKRLLKFNERAVAIGATHFNVDGKYFKQLGAKRFQEFDNGEWHDTPVVGLGRDKWFETEKSLYSSIGNQE